MSGFSWRKLKAEHARTAKRLGLKIGNFGWVGTHDSILSKTDKGYFGSTYVSPGKYKHDFESYDEVRKNPPMYAHHLRERKTHGLNLKQMRRLYAMVSRGSQKAITFARNVLGIPFDETPSQVKAVVKHHVLDLAERKVRGNPARTRYMLVERGTGKPISDVTSWGVSPEQGGYTSREILALRKLGVGTKRFKTVRMRDIRGNPSGMVTEGEIRKMYKRMGQVMYRKTGLYGPYHAISQYGYTLMDKLPTRKSAEDYVIRFYKSKSPSIIRG